MSEVKLKEGDVVFADNVNLTYDGEGYVLSESGLNHANIFTIDPCDHVEHDVKHHIIDDKMVAYFIRNEIHCDEVFEDL